MRTFVVSFCVLCALFYQKAPLPAALPVAANAASVPVTATTGILFQSADGGSSWQDVSSGLPEKFEIRRVLAHQGRLFLGTHGGLMYHTSTPCTGKWQKEHVGNFYTGVGDLEEGKGITGIFPGLNGPYVALHEGGLWKKVPGTAFWQPLHQTLQAQYILCVKEAPDGALYVGCEKGLFQSKDSGRHWQVVFDKEQVSDLAVNHGVLIASTQHGLLRSDDEGAHWAAVLQEKDVWYNIRVLDDQRLAAVNTAIAPDEKLQKPNLSLSSDNGRTWQLPGCNAPAVLLAENSLAGMGRIFDVAQVDNWLFCSHTQGISRSADGGLTWELVQPLTTNRENMFYDLTVSGATIWAALASWGC